MNNITSDFLKERIHIFNFTSDSIVIAINKIFNKDYNDYIPEIRMLIESQVRRNE